MRLTKKIKAFTINELVIVLVITSIVIGLAFSLLSLVRKQISMVRKNYDKQIELKKLETSLYIDFNKYSNVNYDKSKSQLLFVNNLKSTYYIFSDDFIVKNKDTFYVKALKKIFFFDGKTTNQGKVDALKIESKNGFEGNSEIFIFKHNDASVFVN